MYFGLATTVAVVKEFALELRAIRFLQTVITLYVMVTTVLMKFYLMLYENVDWHPNGATHLRANGAT